jgi:hypothetical protein
MQSGHTQECLAIHVGHRINRSQVIEVLAEAFESSSLNCRSSNTRMHPPPQRLRCAPGMFNSLEVKVLYPT